LENQIARLAKGKTEMIMIASAPKIAMAVICFKGGDTFNLKKITKPEEIEDNLPDIMLLLDAGKLIAKTYEIIPGGKVKGILKLYNTGSNSLIGFTGWLTSLLAERDTITKSPFQFHEYISQIFSTCVHESLDFPVLGAASGIEIIN
jgi:hypothetical protein